MCNECAHIPAGYWSTQLRNKVDRMLSLDTCRYVCLLAAQLNMNNYTNNAHSCNVCADVQTRSDPVVSLPTTIPVLRHSRCYSLLIHRLPHVANLCLCATVIGLCHGPVEHYCAYNCVTMQTLCLNNNRTLRECEEWAEMNPFYCSTVHEQLTAGKGGRMDGGGGTDVCTYTGGEVTREHKCVFGEELNKHAFNYDTALKHVHCAKAGTVTQKTCECKQCAIFEVCI